MQIESVLCRNKSKMRCEAGRTQKSVLDGKSRPARRNSWVHIITLVQLSLDEWSWKRWRTDAGVHILVRWWEIKFAKNRSATFFSFLTSTFGRCLYQIFDISFLRQRTFCRMNDKITEREEEQLLRISNSDQCFDSEMRSRLGEFCYFLFCPLNVHVRSIQTSSACFTHLVLLGIRQYWYWYQYIPDTSLKYSYSEVL